MLNLKNKVVLVYGFARSGHAAVELLKDKVHSIYIYDKNFKSIILENKDKSIITTTPSQSKVLKSDKYLKIKKNNNLTQHAEPTLATYLQSNIYLINDFSLLKNTPISFCVISPAVNLKENEVQILKEHKIKIISELELGASFCRGKIFAVTGTNGKTTTVTLLSEIFKNAGKKVFLCGNIGTPISAIAPSTKNGDFIVCEVSSFQLETSQNFHPFASAILNIEPDHLDRHKNIKDYSNLKSKIFNWFNTKKIANLDDKICKEISKKYPNIIQYSINQFSNGCYIKKYDKKLIKNNFLELKNNKKIIKNNKKTLKINKKIIKNDYFFNYFNNNINFDAIFYKNEFIMPVNEIKLLGTRNLSNILCAITLAKQAKISAKIIRQTIINFKGLPHRLEYVATHKNIDFINDSKSTNIASTLSALDATGDNVILLLGGSNKNLDFSPIFNRHKIAQTIIFGEVKNEIKKVVKNTKVIEADNFTDACKIAFNVANKNQKVLLSPACASFDEFRNYEERGEKYKSLINKYIKNTKKN